MAPKKGTKRPADVEVATEAKKMKETLKSYGVSKSMYDGVVEALQHQLADVPQSARDMLIASVLEGICVPCNQRHEFQKAVVEMVAQTLQGVLSKLKVKVDDATAEVSRIEASKAELQAEVQVALGHLEKAMEAEQKGKEDLAEATRAALAAKSKLAEKEKLRSEGDAAHETGQSQKATLEAVLAEEFRALRDGAVEGEDAKEQYKKLEELAEQSGIESSLLTALPTSILKLPQDRGSFDAMVVAQLQEALSKRHSSLEAELLAEEPNVQARKDQVELAMKDLEAAKVHQEKSAEMYLETQKALKGCEDAKKEAKKKVDEAEPSLLSAKKSLEAAALELENYQNYNWTCFETLRDHSVSTEPIEAKDVAPVEAVTEAAVATAGA